MKNTLTIVIPNRDRFLETVQRSLNSIYAQLNSDVKLVVVDYGSDPAYQTQLRELIDSYPLIRLELCPTQGQLWSKSRSINMILKTCTSSHLMVCDMDMIWHPEFLKNQISTFPTAASVYYTVGIMTQEESVLEKAFLDYDIKFATDDEATGISVFPTEQLRSINGFDEFYHGWGSEDTDVHMRLKNAGYKVRFRESEILFKHQWHAKSYRSKSSQLPFHPLLERINHRYFLYNQSFKIIKANQNRSWGVFCDSKDYQKLQTTTESKVIYAIKEELQAFTYFLDALDRSIVLKLEVSISPDAKSLKTLIKKLIGKKIAQYISMEKANEILLEAIIKSHRNCPYKYSFDREKGVIHLVIYLKRNL